MFVKDLFAISPQLTHDLQFENGDFQLHTEGKMLAIEPSYSELIPAGLLRRMGKAVRMGIGAGLPLIQQNEALDGIIIGTANGGLEDCVKFLNQIVEYEEGVLTPTNFVQSTPNALGGQLALMSKNTGYNNTHVNGSLAFENAIIDAQLFLESSTEKRQLLLGAVEEISEYYYNIDSQAGRFKTEQTDNESFLNSNSTGTLCGEGATFFVVSNSSENALAEIVDTCVFSYISQNELLDFVSEFLSKNNLKAVQIDHVITGNNGENRTENWYTEFIQQSFAHSQQTFYKKFCGDYRTASAFATYLGVKIISNSMTLHSNNLSEGKAPKYVLIYNHFDGERHGLILLKSMS